MATGRKTAYITGAASGIGLAVARSLSARGYTLALGDVNLAAAQKALATLDSPESIAVEVDVSSWPSQLQAFETVVSKFGRLDVVIVNAGVGERVFVPNDGGKGTGFVKPDLTVMDVDLTGFVYTASLAIQQMRRQEAQGAWRGKIVGTASVCGFYCVPTLPIYTAAKHGAVGFVRSYGKYLPEEQISLNAVCPHVLRTGISTSAFYDSLESKNLLVPMIGVVKAFEHFIDSEDSGECMEIGPGGIFEIRKAPEVVNAESEQLNELLYHRGRPLHLAKET